LLLAQAGLRLPVLLIGRATQAVKPVKMPD
jgi:hypothetical protein